MPHLKNLKISVRVDNVGKDKKYSAKLDNFVDQVVTCWQRHNIHNMAAQKRKSASGEAPPAKVIKSTKDSRPTKTGKDAPVKTSTDTLASRPVAAAASRLKADEAPMFPRGGASELTPLEKRDIGRQARADAEREDEFDTKPAKAKAKTAKVKAQKGGKRNKSQQEGADDARERVKIEGLSFKVGFTARMLHWDCKGANKE